MLDNNTVRINGYIDNKRTHKDITVFSKTIEVNGNKIVIPKVPHFSDIADIGFSLGLEGVTSYNSYNWVSKSRITSKIV